MPTDYLILLPKGKFQKDFKLIIYAETERVLIQNTSKL